MSARRSSGLVFSSAKNRENLAEIASSLCDAMMVMVMVTNEEIISGECEENGGWPVHARCLMRDP
jgi:hypothetical protein